ncbi:ImmA/IrrE family metallo-endopeptidase [Micromonospora sp. 4G57]|uniref:ImmA/IrrE family metallo-endopeptidase n=1 Tax=Micromonospora sicca TaxID=2202420 RepID=A0ABU5JN96_9ACTN|nr:MULTISPECIES: ImmA/IrrE family metallo-endopeptidase [unclassified Micromonospora]MDZ5447384.1 ImmA/IrrE family metallo-endopeptidase [Micromonospora sp. 4G57]MDZ5494051.1 ImmA/IrrE family metallo-endopeptidase [Micromonospora sp. 4G53]
MIEQLVPTMVTYLTTIGVDPHDLAANPAAVIVTVDDIVLDWVDPGQVGADCSVAALYSGTEVPPRISAVRDASPGRRAFSVLHEFGHHLCTQVDEVADALWDLPEGGRGLEEDLVDAFAAAILLPADTVWATFAAGVDAASVGRLWRTTSASREACCVAAAQQLPAPGYVMLLRPDGRSQFAARHGDAIAVPRETAQTATKLRPALNGGTARGVDRPTLGSGVHTAEMYFDAIAADSYVFAVWVTDSPAWDALPAPLDSRPVGNTAYCGACAREFTTWRAACRHCGEPHCIRCGACECEPGGLRPVTTRRCDRCFQELPLPAFNGDSTTCNDH